MKSSSPVDLLEKIIIALQQDRADLGKLIARVISISYRKGFLDGRKSIGPYRETKQGGEEGWEIGGEAH